MKFQVFVARFGWFWMILIDFGCFWVGIGMWFWLVLLSFGWFGKVVGGFGWLWVNRADLH